MMMVDQCVRLGMAIVIIALISLALYQFSGRAHASAHASAHAASRSGVNTVSAAHATIAAPLSR